MIWLRTALFALVAPGVGAGLLPLLLIRSGIGPHLSDLGVHALGLLLAAAGVGGLLWCYALFASWGRGTPAPFDPPRLLVSVGPYCWSRNPIYVSIGLIVVGEALASGALVLLGYALVFAPLVYAYVRFVEEPELRRRFGNEYEGYCAAVPRWLPGFGRSGRPPRPAA